jgi:hypothetical protein
LEAFRVVIKLSKELHVFVDVVEGARLRGSGEENGGIAAWNGVFLGRGLVIGS